MIWRQLRPIADLVLTVGMVALVRAPQSVAVSFDGVPPDATSVTVFDYREDDVPRLRSRDPLQAKGRAVVSGRPGRSVLVMFSRADGAYVLDGPFIWPEAEAVRSLERVWRRTIAATDAGGRAPLEWVSAAGPGDRWPRCAWETDERWQCVGVAVDAGGVVVAQSASGIAWSVVTARTTSTPPRQHSRWGRLLQVRRPGAGPSAALDLKVRRPIAAPPHRLRSIRLEVGDVPITLVHVAEDDVWIAADESPPGAWIEVRAGEFGPTLVPVQDARSGPATLPLVVLLAPSAAIQGKVVDAAGMPVASALVSLFRLIDPPETRESTARGEPRARRIGAGQVITADDGAFAFERLPDADFDVLAWHGQLGRASRLVRSPADDVVIHLAPRAVVRGRVLVGGVPAGDVPIVSVPDVSAVSTADDLTELKGGDGRTGADGRFALALAERGGGELRIGGEGIGVRRVRLPPGSSAAGLDLGDLELPGPLSVTFVLDQDPGCGLVAVGPVGRAGLQVVSGRRTQPGMFDIVLPEEGTWRLTLSCGQSERAVVPALVAVSSSTRSVNLRVQ